MCNGDRLKENFEMILVSEYQKEPKQATKEEIHYALAKAVMVCIHENWKNSKIKHSQNKRAYYFSAEFLIGRIMHNNLYCARLYDMVEEILKGYDLDISALEEIEDAALGNGGLGRLAACFLDSAATHNIPLDGYGIRYSYGFFKQTIVDGFQNEFADDWSQYGDAWSVRCENEAVPVEFEGQTVLAVPYDIAIIGYDTENINTLRLWQSEAVQGFDFKLFNEYKFNESVQNKIDAENITKVLYPNDNEHEGKKLRLKQQYFFCSASLKDIIRKYKENHDDFMDFAKMYAIQLNDTHPAMAIPELIRLLIDVNGLDFNTALNIAREVFSYTNHTIMAEALEKWDTELFKSVVPRVYEIICLINEHLVRELSAKGYKHDKIRSMLIIQNGVIHMARLSIYVSSHVNGVAKIHTEIIKNRELKDWYETFPERFLNKTNGITQRRWLGLCNPELAILITELLCDNSWTTNLQKLEGLEKFADDEQILRRFMAIKTLKKKQLTEYILKHDGVKLSEDFVFSTQIKRLHEYKRQLLNAFSILDIYYELKAGNIKNFNKSVYIFGAKSAPGYFMAKAIIKYIGEVAKLINNDDEMKDKLKVVFISNYNVSYAEKLVTSADISEQISTAGTEASGTGNMKFMLNGTVTLGTYDGANVEIVEEAGFDNNYIFGARVEDIERIKDSYDPKGLYNDNPRIKRAVNSLIDGTLDDGGTGMFEGLYNSLVKDKGWNKPDMYYLLYDFEEYVDTKLKANRDYSDKFSFARKCFINIAKSGKFSSDRTIKEYAKEIWHIEAAE